MKRSAYALAVLLTVHPALAGSGRWTVEAEDDPFTGGSRIMAGYSTSPRSGIYLSCDTATKGTLHVRLVPGYAYNPALTGMSPQMRLAVDGEIVAGASPGRIGAVGDNLAAVDYALTGVEMVKLVEAFHRAQRQIAFQDGISDQSYLLKAAGSTAAAVRLRECLAKSPAG